MENGQAELSGPGVGRVCLPEEVRLRGHGVVLREWKDGDLGAMVKLFDDPEVAYWTPLVSPFGPQAARAYLERAGSGGRPGSGCSWRSRWTVVSRWVRCC